MRTMRRWIRRLFILGLLVGMASFVYVNKNCLGMLSLFVNAQEVTAEEALEVLENVDVAEIVTEYDGVVSALTGVDYTVSESNGETYVSVSVNELGELAGTLVTIAETAGVDAAGIAAGYGIELEAILQGDYSAFGLTGEETITLSERELESLLSMAQMYLNQ